MDDRRVGAAIRAMRIRRFWTQDELALRAKTSRWTIARIEDGRLGTVDVGRVRAVAAALGARYDGVLRWDGAELDRLLNARHSAMHELVARRLRGLPSWEFTPEVSFSVYGERGVIDILAFHRPMSSLLVIELKTEVVDIQELLGTLDRKRRLARVIAQDREWRALSVSVLVAVAEGRTNRRRVEAHRTVLRAALPDSPRRLRSWLDDPVGTYAALVFVSDEHGTRARSSIATPKRVGRAQPRTIVARVAANGEPAARLAARSAATRS